MSEKSLPKTVTNKSQAIRTIMAAHPDWSPKAVAEEATLCGFPMAASYVSIVKYNAAKKKGSAAKFRAGKVKAVARKTGKSVQQPDANDALKVAASLVVTAGGVAQAREALAVVENIHSVLQQL